MCFSAIATALGIGGSLLNGFLQKDAAEKGADAQTIAALGALDLQKQGLDFSKDQYKFLKSEYLKDKKNQLPWLTAGKNALNRYQIELGLKKGGSAFKQTPGYKFMVKEGERGVMSNLAALGMKNSGAALKALTKYRTGVADQEYDDYLTRLGGLASGRPDVGPAPDASGVQQGYANVGNAMQNVGTYQASGYLGGANALTQGIGGAITNFSNALGYNSYPQAPATGGLW